MVVITSSTEIEMHFFDQTLKLTGMLCMKQTKTSAFPGRSIMFYIKIEQMIIN